MILVDVNLLIYAVDSDSPHHRAARRWLEETLSGETHVGLAWIVLLAFLRITTRPDILVQPLPVAAALEYVEEWLQQPNVEPVSAGASHWPILRNLVAASGLAGNLTTDAHLAAMAIERGASLYSTDHDFQRFAGVDHINPLQPR